MMGMMDLLDLLDPLDPLDLLGLKAPLVLGVEAEKEEARVSSGSGTVILPLSITTQRIH